MILFKHIAFVGKDCLVNEEFAIHLKEMADKASSLGLQISVNSSYRENSKHIQGAIVPPATMSNHFIGEAIDCNIWEGGKFWNSEMLKNPTGKVLELITYCEGFMRWGGRFKVQDSIHFDSGLNIKNPSKWNEKYKLIHT